MTRRRKIHSADRLLECLWRAWCSATGAPVQRLGAFSSWADALYCPTRRCPGEPRRLYDRRTEPPTPLEDEQGRPLLQCSRCQVRWGALPIEMGTNEIGSRKPRRAIGRESDELADVLEIGAWVVDRVIRERPLDATIWVIHVVGPGRPHEKTGVPSLGVARDEIPARLEAAQREGVIDLHGQAVTEYRVRQGIRWSRIRVEELIESRGGM